MKENKNNKSNKKKNKPKQISIFTVVFALVVIGLAVGLYYAVRAVFVTLKYKQYTKQMEYLQYDELYNNHKANSIQAVTNDEMLRVIIGSLNNVKDISKLYNYDNIASENDKLLKYSAEMNLNSRVNVDNIDKKAKKIDAVIVLVKTLESVTGENIEQAKLSMSNDKLKQFTDDEKQVLAKAVTLGMLKNKNSAITNSTLLKGELNQLVITIVNDFCTMYHGSYTVDSNGNTLKQDVNVVTDKNKLPSNYKEYPYIVDNIDKSVYEYDYIVNDSTNFQNPYKVYSSLGYLYGQYDEILTDYLEYILNVDYNTITEEKFLANIKSKVIYSPDEQDIKNYVAYVKKNKIKLEGQVMPLLPIIYNNGGQYMIRTKVQFKVLSSNTNYNLLYGDNKVKYNAKEFELYVDVPMGMTLNSNSLKVIVDSLANYIVGANNNIIVGD